MSRWPYEKLEYSWKEVDSAIKEIVSEDFGNGDDLIRVFAILANWRDAHMYPCVTVRNTLQNRAKQIEASAGAVMRIKRTASILEKLSRMHTKPTKMHDVAGCRIVLGSVEKVYQLVNMYKAKDLASQTVRSQCEHEYSKYDYILKPKKSGYRGIHLILTYRAGHLHSTTSHTKSYDGMKIEIQFRTLLQHAWATAVEIVDSFTNQGLKIGKGTDEWKDFFIVASDAIALIDRPRNEIALPNQIMPVVSILGRYKHLLHQLDNFKQATQKLIQTRAADSSTKNYVLHLIMGNEMEPGRVDVYPFKSDEYRLAQSTHSLIEKTLFDKPDQQVLLVQANTIEDLKAAYPNFFLDITAFTNLLRAFEAGRAYDYVAPPIQET